MGRRMPGERGATATGLRGALRRLRRIDEEGLEAAYDAGAYGTQYEGYGGEPARLRQRAVDEHFDSPGVTLRLFCLRTVRNIID